MDAGAEGVISNAGGIGGGWGDTTDGRGGGGGGTQLLLPMYRVNYEHNNFFK